MPVGPINDLAQVFAQPQVKSRGLQLELPHPLAGSVPSVANPIRMSATPPRYEPAPPTLGQHTHEVLGRLGIEERELQELARDGVSDPQSKKIPPPLLRRRVSCGGRRAN